jgi:hypothetical protein
MYTFSLNNHCAKHCVVLRQTLRQTLRCVALRCAFYHKPCVTYMYSIDYEMHTLLPLLWIRIVLQSETVRAS